jgi:hypothetical protein
MKILFYDSYRKKRESKHFANIKEEMIKDEKRISLASSVDDLTFYQNISTHKKIIELAKARGWYRLALFFYEDYCLFVDIELKQNLEKVTSEVLFRESNETYIEYIKNNQIEDKIEEIDLSNYQTILDINKQQDSFELVYESFKFSKQLEDLNDKELKQIFKLITKIFDNNKTYSNYNSIYQVSDDTYSIYYKIFKSNDIDIYYFIGFEDENLKEVDEIIDENELIKKSSKSYPLEIFLEDVNEWIDYIVKNSDGNIALSPEEENILTTLKSYNNDKKYPFFINGRAGSGKSTILQYLFADYIVEFLRLSKKRELEYKPLYLTYNERLKDKAIDKVSSIILAKTDKKLKDKLNLKDKKVIQSKIEEFFKSFDVKDGYNFLEELLYDNQKDNSLKNKKKITFAQIKEYFSDLISKKGKRFKNYTPELIWYVIRSYIKGRGVIENDKIQPLSLENYQKLPKKLRTIKDSVYKTILKEFYPTYTRYLNNNNYFDDLDLIFEVFKQNAFDKKYSVIFCDEAQDFTKIEFNLILNLNIFLEPHIKIDNFDYKNVPIVFAGDPFQTINPTGFSFEYLKALVYESYQEKGANLELNYKELAFNYRSNEDIIKFSNLVQALRGVLFKESVAFQTKWLDNYNSYNSLLYFDKSIDIKGNDIEQNYKFIFPTIRANEFFQDDELLNSLEMELHDTPLEVKGLEYDLVVLYRFGDFYLKELKNLSTKIENGFEDKESSLAYEYFFNNFYVAITRAKERVLVIDSHNAKDNFWKYIDVELLYDKYKSIFKKGEIDKNNFLQLNEGADSDLIYKEKDKRRFSKNRVKTELFDRYDTSANKGAILGDVAKILRNRNLNEVYEHILDGFRAEYNGNYLKATKTLMESVNMAYESGELANSEINYLTRKAFESLWLSIELEDSKSLEFIKEYENAFKDLGLKFERKTKLLKKFLNGKYAKTLDYLKDEFSKKDMDAVLEFIIKKSLYNLDTYELSDYLMELYKNEFINKELIIEIVKRRLEDEKNYKSLIKVFDIDDLKKTHKDIYCKMNLIIDENDIDCLVYANKIDKVLDVIKNNNEVDVSNYARAILYHLSNHSKEFHILDMGLIVDTYMKYYEDFNNLSVWEYLIKENIKNENIDNISILMKLFENLSYKEKREHLLVLVNVIKNSERPILIKQIFNTLITLFSANIDIIKICDIVVSLEKTLSFYDDENIRKILGFYQHYLNDRQNKHKRLIGSRFVKLKFELDKEGRNYHNIDNDDEWFDFVKRKVKFLHIESNRYIIRQIPIRMESDICYKLVNMKSVDEIYNRIISSYSQNEKSKKEEIEESVVSNEIKVTNETQKDDNMDVVQKLEEIQEFIDENRDSFNKRDVRKILNMVNALRDDLKELKKELQ